MDWKRLAQIGLIPVAIVVVLWVVADGRKAYNSDKVAEAKAQIAADVKKDAEHKQEVAKAPVPPSEPKEVYDPPCAAGSTPHGCNDRVWGKRLLEGTVWKVTFYGKGPKPYKMKDKYDASLPEHYVPDYTTVEFYNEGDEEIPSEEFCGNLLDKFAPGQKVKRILLESDLADYNGCYTIYPVIMTFGGKDHVPASK
jgi:hypothetical protein